MLVVGDSTAGQLYLSLVSLLRAEHNAPSSKHRHRQRASACGDTVRLSHVRSDLLLWTSSLSDITAARVCDSGTLYERFMQRAVRDADLLVFTLGLHWAGSMEEARARGPPELEGARLAFSSMSLRHTLSAALEARAAYGRSAASMLLVGTPLPVPGCSRYTEPFATLDEYALAEAHVYGTAKYGLRWRHQVRLNLNVSCGPESEPPHILRI